MPILKHEHLRGAPRSVLMPKTALAEHAMIENAKRNAVKVAPIYEAEDLVKLAVEQHGDALAVAWSGGKCSTAVLHMARRLKDDIKVVFHDTTVEYPETYTFIRMLQREWNLNLIRTKPEMTFWQCVERYGFPHVRLPNIEAERGKTGTPRCCYHLKEKPMMKLREYGIEAVLTGLRAAEARIRMLRIGWSGQFYYAEKYKCWRYHPIVFWASSRLDSYIAEHRVPLSDLYTKKGVARSGCWPCTGFRKWKTQLMYTNPKLYEFLIKRMDEQRLARHFYDSRIAPCSDRG